MRTINSQRDVARDQINVQNMTRQNNKEPAMHTDQDRISAAMTNSFDAEDDALYENGTGINQDEIDEIETDDGTAFMNDETLDLGDDDDAVLLDSEMDEIQQALMHGDDTDEFEMEEDDDMLVGTEFEDDDDEFAAGDFVESFAGDEELEIADVVDVDVDEAMAAESLTELLDAAVFSPEQSIETVKIVPQVLIALDFASRKDLPPLSPKQLKNVIVLGSGEEDESGEVVYEERNASNTLIEGNEDREAGIAVAPVEEVVAFLDGIAKNGNLTVVNTPTSIDHYLSMLQLALDSGIEGHIRSSMLVGDNDYLYATSDEEVDYAALANIEYPNSAGEGGDPNLVHISDFIRWSVYTNITDVDEDTNIRTAYLNVNISIRVPGLPQRDTKKCHKFIKGRVLPFVNDVSKMADHVNVNFGFTGLSTFFLANKAGRAIFDMLESEGCTPYSRVTIEEDHETFSSFSQDADFLFPFNSDVLLMASPDNAEEEEEDEDE